MQRKKEILAHIIFWFWFWIFPLIVQKAYSFEKGIFSTAGSPFFLSQLLLGFLIFYIQYLFIIPKYLKEEKRKTTFILSIIGLFFLYVVLRYIIEEVLYLKFFGIHNYTKGTKWHFYILDNLYFGGRFIIWATLIWYIINYTRLEKEKYEILKAKNQAEVNFLRSQINPHFIFNTLNNIYSLVYHKSDKALPAIDKLGELMRYITDDSGKDFIRLSREVSYIRSIIELASLRNPEETYVNFTTEGDLENITIAPLILVPFVENGLKHGDLTCESRPFTINLRVQNQKLIMQTSNKILAKKNEPGSGIGLDNIRKRLMLIYPDNHLLNVHEDDTTFITTLQINLS